MGGPNKITNFHLNTKKQTSWFWWPLSRKNHLQGAPEPDPDVFKAFKRSFKTISKNHWKPIQKPLLFRPPKKLVFAIYIYSILGQPGLTLEREARLIGEPICYDKELERSLAINAKIGKNIYFAFGLTSASHYLDIGLTFILTSASHSFWHRLRRIVLTSALPGIADQPAS